MKNLLFTLILLIFISCSTEKEKIKSPFKAGEEVYLKIDTSRAIILFDAGMWDQDNFVYRISHKTDSGTIEKKWTFSSELFKK